MSGTIKPGSAQRDRICRGPHETLASNVSNAGVSCFGLFLARQNEISLGLIQITYYIPYPEILFQLIKLIK